MTPEELAQERDEATHLVLTATALAAAVGVRCPMCPGCGGVPEPLLASIVWPGQAMCAADDCPVWMWNPTVSARENLVEGQVVDLSHLDPPAAP